jgi:hypothetical protein
MIRQHITLYLTVRANDMLEDLKRVALSRSSDTRNTCPNMGRFPRFACSHISQAAIFQSSKNDRSVRYFYVDVIGCEASAERMSLYMPTELSQLAIISLAFIGQNEANAARWQ